MLRKFMLPGSVLAVLVGTAIMALAVVFGSQGGDSVTAGNPIPTDTATALPTPTATPTQPPTPTATTTAPAANTATATPTPCAPIAACPTATPFGATVTATATACSGAGCPTPATKLVTICHYDRNQSGPNAGPHTITISANAVAQHLANHTRTNGYIGDDQPGPCPEPTREGTATQETSATPAGTATPAPTATPGKG